MTGVFQVYSPNNYHDGYTDHTLPGPQQVFAYNDLDMRQQHLCELLASPCSPTSKATEVIKRITFGPLPPKGH